MGIISGLQAIKSVQTIKSGGVAKISIAQITNLIVNLPDAKNNLSEDQFSEIYKKYNELQKCKTKMPCDMDGYLKIALQIIQELDSIAPYEKYSGGNELEFNFLMQELRTNGSSYGNEGPLLNTNQTVPTSEGEKRPSNVIDFPSKQETLMEHYQRILDCAKENFDSLRLCFYPVPLSDDPKIRAANYVSYSGATTLALCSMEKVCPDISKTEKISLVSTALIALCVASYGCDAEGAMAIVHEYFENGPYRKLPPREKEEKADYIQAAYTSLRKIKIPRKYKDGESHVFLVMEMARRSAEYMLIKPDTEGQLLLEGCIEMMIHDVISIAR